MYTIYESMNNISNLQHTSCDQEWEWECMHLSFPKHTIPAIAKSLNFRLYICDATALCFLDYKNDRAINNDVPFQATYIAGYISMSDKTLIFIKSRCRPVKWRHCIFKCVVLFCIENILSHRTRIHRYPYAFLVSG